MNLTGPERASIERGQVICHEKLTLTSDRFDAFLEVRPAAAKGIKNHQRVRIHLGTAERLGKIVVLGAEEKVEPKAIDLLPNHAQRAAAGLCAATISSCATRLRGELLAGGVVIHPWAKRHKRE